jgi:hypothetical protein
MLNPWNIALQASETNDFASRLHEDFEDFNLVKNAPKVLSNGRRANLQPDEIRLQKSTAVFVVKCWKNVAAPFFITRFSARSEQIVLESTIKARSINCSNP